MKCKDAVIMISMEHDGELSESEMLRLNRHVSMCDRCAQERESLVSLSATMHAWLDESPSEWLAQSFRYKLDELDSAARSAPRRSILGWSAGISAVAAVVAIAGILLHSHVMPVATVARQPLPAIHTSAPLSPVPHVAINIVPKKVPVTVAELDSEQIPTVEKSRRRPARAAALRVARHHSAYAMIAKASVPDEDISLSPRAMRHEASKPDEERMVISKLSAARKARQDSAAMVAKKIDGAGDAMNQTVERVRGTLRKVSFVLAESTPDTGNASDSQGGNPL